MIKIIKHGHEQYRTTCEYCECVFSFEDEDIQSSSRGRSGTGTSDPDACPRLCPDTERGH